jgi:hypothetical protein
MGGAKKLGLTVTLLSAILFLCMLLFGCTLPVPPPVPGPTPTPADAAVIDMAPADVPAAYDPFKARDFNCHLPIVAAQYTEASPKVEACLASPPLACLAGLLGAYDIASVTCLVRDLGAEANSAVLAGTASGNDEAVEANARVFINAEDMGFK